MRYSEGIVCNWCGFASRIATADKAKEGICPHCNRRGLKPLAY